MLGNSSSSAVVQVLRQHWWLTTHADNPETTTRALLVLLLSYQEDSLQVQTRVCVPGTATSITDAQPYHYFHGARTQQDSCKQ